MQKLPISSFISIGFAVALQFALPSSVALAADDHHHHDAFAIELQLNGGQKWQTDAPLRQAMRDINHAVQQVLDDIHQQQLSDAGYVALAQKINQQVAYMIANCQLEPAADEQLHIVIARLMMSAQTMEQNNPAPEKNDASVKLVGTLYSYADFFEDAEFVKPSH